MVFISSATPTVNTWQHDSSEHFKELLYSVYNKSMLHHYTL